MGERADLRSAERDLRDLYDTQLFQQDPAMAKLEYLNFSRESRAPRRQVAHSSYSELMHGPITGDDLVVALQEAGTRLLATADATTQRFQEGIIDSYLEDNEAAPFAKIVLAFSGLSPKSVGRPLTYQLSRVQEHREDADVTLRQYLTLYRTRRYSPFRECDIRVTTIHLLSGIATERRDEPTSRFVPIMEAKDLLVIDDPLAPLQETEQLHAMLQALDVVVRGAETNTH